MLVWVSCWLKRRPILVNRGGLDAVNWFRVALVEQTSPRNLRLQNQMKARIQDDPRSRWKKFKVAVCRFGTRAGWPESISCDFRWVGRCELVWDSCWLNRRQFFM